MEVNCKHCSGNKIIKQGKAKTHFREKQVYYCKDCQSDKNQSWISERHHNTGMGVSLLFNGCGFKYEEYVRGWRMKGRVPKPLKYVAICAESLPLLLTNLVK